MHNLTRKVKKMKIDFYEHGNISDNLEVDYYTPLTLTFKENSDRYDSEIFYYRFINQESSFVEIKVNSVTLKIIEIVIVSINKIEYQDLIVNDSELVNPIVSSDTFLSNSIITNNENFTFYISNNKQLILNGSYHYQWIPACTGMTNSNIFHQRINVLQRPQADIAQRLNVSSTLPDLTRVNLILNRPEYFGDSLS